MTRPMPGFVRVALVALVAGAAACSNAGSDLGLSALSTNKIVTKTFLDLDGSRTFTTGDPFFAGARVSLRPANGGKPIQTLTSNTLGDAQFDGVALGEYIITVDAASIGDSLQVAAIDTAHVVLGVLDSNKVVVIRLAYPEVSIRQARLLSPGKRVFLRGVVLAGVQSFRDTTSHVSDSSGTIRLTRVSLRGGLTGNVPGDSVSILGLSSSRAGQPTLDQAVLSRFGQRPAPIPQPVSTAVAASASSGGLDAAFVVITGAIISDTATTAPDFRVTGSDGSGPVTVLIDANISINRNAFRPGFTMNIRGVLVPTGTGTWVLKPRDTSDITVF